MIAALSESRGGRGLRRRRRHWRVLTGAPDAGAQHHLATGRKRHTAGEYLARELDGASGGRREPESAIAPEQAVEAGLMGCRRVILLLAITMEKHPFLVGACALVFVVRHAEGQFDRAGLCVVVGQPGRRWVGVVLV